MIALMMILSLVFSLLVFFALTLHHFLPLIPMHRLTPPGSFGWPLLGETLSFLKPHTSNEMGEFLDEHCARYGKVFRSHVFGSPTIVSCDHELNSFILQNEEKLFQCRYPKPIHGVLGNSSMLVVGGDRHKTLRSLALTLVVAVKSKRDYLVDIEKAAILVMESWKDKQEVLFWTEAKKFTFDVKVKQILGLMPDDPRTTRILESFNTFMKGLVSLPIRIPGTHYARAVQARGRICAILKSILEECGTKTEKPMSEGDLLETIVSHSGLSVDERISLLLDLLLGGHETTSLLMCMVIYFLGQSPPSLKLLKEEHMEIGREKKGEYLNWQEYKRMERTQHVVNEALRCGNVVKFLHRKAIQNVRFKDCFIPCGWKVLPIFSAVHLDPSLHENAHQFRPKRWMSDISGKTFTPFGGGSRLCPGSDLARVETAFFLHHLLLNFRWIADEADAPLAYPYVEFKKGLTLRIEKDLIVEREKRERKMYVQDIK